MNSFQPLGVTYGGTYPNRSVSTNNTPVETHWINDEYDWRKSNIKWYFNDERRFAMRALLGFRWYFSFLSNSKSMTFEWEDSKKSKPTLIIPAIYIFWILNSKVTSQMAFGVKSSNLCQHKKKKKTMGICSSHELATAHSWWIYVLLRIRRMESVSSESYSVAQIQWPMSLEQKYVKKTFESKNGPHTHANPIFVQCRQRLSHFDA